MSRRVKEFIDIGEHVSLDELIGKLVEVRDNLPDESEAELRLRGDEIFGRRITISYLREQTEEEAECEKRYADAATRSQGARARTAAAGARRGLLPGAGQAREAAHRRLRPRSSRAELQRQAVHAITQARRFRPVVEHVAQMPAAAAAEHFRPFHQQASVRARDDGVGKRPPKARPAVPLSNFVAERNSGQRAARADECALAVLVIERAREWPLGRGLAQHRVALRPEHPPPFGRRAVHGEALARACAARTSEQENARGGGAAYSKHRPSIDLAHRTAYNRSGGAGGIRTLDTVLPYTHFPGERLRPLGHRSAFRWKGAHLR